MAVPRIELGTPAFLMLLLWELCSTTELYRRTLDKKNVYKVFICLPEMVVDEVVSVSSTVISSLGKIGLWLQALGIIAVLWIIFQSIPFYYNRKRMQEVLSIRNDMKRIEDKIDRLVAKR